MHIRTIGYTLMPKCIGLDNGELQFQNLKVTNIISNGSDAIQFKKGLSV